MIIDASLGKTVQVIAFLSAIMHKTGHVKDERRRLKYIERLKREGKMVEGLSTKNPKPGHRWVRFLISSCSLFLLLLLLLFRRIMT